MPKLRKNRTFGSGLNKGFSSVTNISDQPDSTAKGNLKGGNVTSLKKVLTSMSLTGISSGQFVDTNLRAQLSQSNLLAQVPDKQRLRRKTLSNFPIGKYADDIEMKSKSSQELTSIISRNEDADSDYSIAEPILL